MIAAQAGWGKASNQQRFIWYHGSSCLSSLSPDQRREEEQLRQQLHSTAQQIWSCTTPHVFFLLANMSSAMLIKQDVCAEWKPILASAASSRFYNDLIIHLTVHSHERMRVYNRGLRRCGHKDGFFAPPTLPGAEAAVKNITVSQALG
jgi:hypothetical protein